ncbi:Clr5 domain-containing protein [Aspergillus ibericus CBS 121593]|uniref:Clr5 domain-containing protein n=1 Tax=Aspergillus ibericus CBS 121593 TaxID=1448316 RepID=A0A395HBP7_9EURO|nr:hypothetical protein BO80DRAFT_234737 [Aspergillus ibericus CBS 121593]RAL04368.1 hypothetical protein BO80DRAFT_234737 [Aspergillus ibericus CBS 121593]
MKNSIPSDVWERKKALIAKLYKDEEWPLKQVIKQIRSDDFNPSETQLRSRLKKWRVTKPSRQTRKKSDDSQQEATGDDSSQEDASPKDQASTVSPKARPPLRSVASDLSISEPEWYMANDAYTRQDGMPTTVSFDGQHISNVWAPMMAQQSPLSPSHKQRDPSHASSVMVLPSSNSYDSPHTSPLMDSMLINSASSLASPFHDHSYAVTTDCMQTPATTAGPIQWSIPQWYSMPLEAGSPFYTSAPLSPPIDPAMHLMSPHAQTPPPSSIGRQQMADLHEGTWKRAMSAPYGQDAAGGHPRLEQKGPQPRPLERKASLQPKSAGQPAMGLVSPPSFYPHGQHPAMCAPMYPYPGPEPLVHRPQSIDF